MHRHCYRILFCVLSIIKSFSSGQHSTGIINSTIVDQPNQFPHHVNIFVPESGHCNGVIIAPNWILTAVTCVGFRNDSDITLMFQRKNFETDYPLEPKSYHISVTQERVIKHDTLNLALISLPLKLSVNQDVKVVPILNEGKQDLVGQKGILSGPNENGTTLAYGEVEIINNKKCTEVYSWFNGTQALCTLGWGNSSTVPCLNAQGGGLLIDWPSQPKLVGIFSAPLACLSYVPAEYNRIDNNLQWIEQVTDLRVNQQGYFVARDGAK